MNESRITEELGRRTSRAPDFERESRALVELARAMAQAPESVLQRLAEQAMELTGAETAGICLLEETEGKKNFRWHVIAGRLASQLRGMAPQDFSLCGVTMETGEAQLFVSSGGHGSSSQEAAPRTVENLLIPFSVDGQPVGTIWLMASDKPGGFDGEDLRIMQSLGQFCAGAVRAVGALQALRQREERYWTLVQGIPDYAIMLTTLQGVVTEWSQGAERVTGYTSEEALGRHLSMFYRQEDVAAGIVEDELQEALLEGRAERVGWRVRRGGERFWADEVVTTVLDNQGAVVGFTKIARDLSERKRMQDALEESEKRYRLAVENVRDYAIVTYDVENRIKSWNAGAEQIFGYAESEVLGQVGEILFTLDDRAAGEVEKELVNATRRDRTPDERWHVKKDGTRFWATGVMHAMHDETGRLLGYVKVCRDETQRRNWEEETRRAKEELEVRVAERTEELRHANRDLQAEVAERRASEAARIRLLDQLVSAQELERGRIGRELHDHLGQHLTALLLGLSAAREQIGAESPLQPHLKKLQEMADRLTHDVRDLALELRPPVLDEFGLKAAVADHLEDWAERTGIAVDLQWSLPDGERLPVGMETAIYRVLQEGLTNVARHAGASRVGVIVERLGSFVRMIVEDNGVGFDVESALDSSSRRSSGLGLVGMHERAALLNGTLTIESEPGRGTSIFCRIPLGGRTTGEPAEER